MRISLESFAPKPKDILAVGKEGGRTIVSDDGKQYMWTTGGLAVCGDETATLQKDFLPCFVRKHSWSNKKRHYPATRKHTRK